MTNQDRATSLYNILRRERERGFDDRAVIGGMDKFLERFADDLAPYLRGPARYASMSADERSAWADGVVGRMREAGVSVRQSSATTTDARASAPTRDERPTEQTRRQRSASQAEARAPAPTRDEKPTEQTRRQRSATQAEARASAPTRDEKPTEQTRRQRSASQAEARASAPTRDEKPTEQTRKRRSAPRKPPAPSRPLRMSDDVTLVKGIWRKALPLLHKLGVRTVGDLVRLYPGRYNDFTDVRRVSQLSPGDDQTAILTVWEATQTMLGKQKSTQAVLGDDTGNVRAVWFNNPWIAAQLKHGARVALSGKVSVYRGNLVFQAPEYEILDGDDAPSNAGSLVPVYPSTQGLSQRALRTAVRRALDACLPQVEEFLPEDLLHRAGLIGLRNAVGQMHYPDDEDALRTARRRLAFDELFLMQLSVLRRRNEWREEGAGIPVSVNAAALERFLGSLPFDLTGAQSRSLQEILADIRSDRAMNRLLQGDVGSGKTAVAAAAMLAAVNDGKQAALMAPTEILAEQHFLTICRLLADPAETSTLDPEGIHIQTLPVAGAERRITVALLLGAQRKRVRDDVRSLLSAGMVDMIIGTHALIQEGVNIPNLALAAVDEQHRFGVLQRAALRDKGERPHMLAMSATPIPRSLALTVWGDLDVSVIDEMPPGRLPIRTRFVESDRRGHAYAFVRKEVEDGRQAFVVCPLIEGSEVIQTSAAQEEFERLSEHIYPDLSVGLLHGRMSLKEKEAVMDDFKNAEIDILVSTPVVEVGIDVPNASVMLIDGAERFGLSQLHQFRGRVGRGEARSHCLLLSESPGAEAMTRLKLMERVSDGFQLAEEDLKLRGPGDYLGTRQSGLPSLSVAQITDQDILSLARREATRLLDADPELARDEHRQLAARFEEYAANLAQEVS